jgi:ABC-type sugar transport system substrate-binding protein
MRLSSAALLALLVASPARAQEPYRFDVLITAGWVLDGTGNPWFPADVGIRGDRIVALAGR